MVITNEQLENIYNYIVNRSKKDSSFSTINYDNLEAFTVLDNKNQNALLKKSEIEDKFAYLYYQANNLTSKYNSMLNDVNNIKSSYIAKGTTNKTFILDNGERATAIVDIDDEVEYDADSLHIDFITSDDDANSKIVHIDSATQERAGLMSAADKKIVDKAVLEGSDTSLNLIEDVEDIIGDSAEGLNISNLNGISALDNNNISVSSMLDIREGMRVEDNKLASFGSRGILLNQGGIDFQYATNISHLVNSKAIDANYENGIACKEAFYVEDKLTTKDDIKINGDNTITSINKTGGILIYDKTKNINTIDINGIDSKITFNTRQGNNYNTQDITLVPGDVLTTTKFRATEYLSAKNAYVNEKLYFRYSGGNYLTMLHGLINNRYTIAASDSFGVVKDNKKVIIDNDKIIFINDSTTHDTEGTISYNGDTDVMYMDTFLDVQGLITAEGGLKANEQIIANKGLVANNNIEVKGSDGSIIIEDNAIVFADLDGYKTILQYFSNNGSFTIDGDLSTDLMIEAGTLKGNKVVVEDELSFKYGDNKESNITVTKNDGIFNLSNDTMIDGAVKILNGNNLEIEDDGEIYLENKVGSVSIKYTTDDYLSIDNNTKIDGTLTATEVDTQKLLCSETTDKVTESSSVTKDNIYVSYSGNNIDGSTTMTKDGIAIYSENSFTGTSKGRYQAGGLYIEGAENTKKLSIELKPNRVIFGFGSGETDITIEGYSYRIKMPLRVYKGENYNACLDGDSLSINGSFTDEDTATKGTSTLNVTDLGIHVNTKITDEDSSYKNAELISNPLAGFGARLYNDYNDYNNQISCILSYEYLAIESIENGETTYKIAFGIDETNIDYGVCATNINKATRNLSHIDYDSITIKNTNASTNKDIDIKNYDVLINDNSRLGFKYNNEVYVFNAQKAIELGLLTKV